MIPSKGKARNGTSAVAVRGSASVIHQAAIRTMIAVVRQAAGVIPAGGGTKSMTTKARRPPHRPRRAAIHISLMVARVMAWPGSRANPVIPAKAGTSGHDSSTLLHEVPAFGFPSKYYFDGVPPGTTV